MREIVIVDGVRTPQGAFGGALKDLSSTQLAEIVIKELIRRTKVDVKIIDEVILGCVIQTSDAPNLARVAALRSGIPIEATSFTVQRNCASGIQAIVSAAQLIKVEEADVVIAGGAESMSNAPYVSRDMRFGKRIKHSQLIDTLWEGLTDPLCNQVMGETAENLVEEFKISRTEQDKFAISSHKKAFAATRSGKFKDELVPVTVAKKLYGKDMPPEIFSEDESINIGLSEQTLALYPTIFKENGTVTPGNSCPISDGAAAVLIMSADKAKELGYNVLGRIVSYAFAGVEPRRMGMGPTTAVPKALKRAGLALKDVNLIEINEAFAAQCLSCEKILPFDPQITNVNGGAIALGHPVGATGTRIVITLLNELKKRNLRYGLATLCVGGGQGAAVIVERP